MHIIYSGKNLEKILNQKKYFLLPIYNKKVMSKNLSLIFNLYVFMAAFAFIIITGIIMPSSYCKAYSSKYNFNSKTTLLKQSFNPQTSSTNLLERISDLSEINYTNNELTLIYKIENWSNTNKKISSIYNLIERKDKLIYNLGQLSKLALQKQLYHSGQDYNSSNNNILIVIENPNDLKKYLEKKNCHIKNCKSLLTDLFKPNNNLNYYHDLIYKHNKELLFRQKLLGRSNEVRRKYSSA